MKKLALIALLTLGLTGCSSVSPKSNLTKEKLVGEWFCRMNYNDLNMITDDLSKLGSDGKIENTGIITSYTFEPLLFKYGTKDQGSWDLIGNQLVFDFDLTKRQTDKLTPKKVLDLLKQKKYQPIAKYEQELFDILNKKDRQKENNKITLEISDFNQDSFNVKQDMGEKVYFGECMTPKKLEALTSQIQNNPQKTK